jgi:uncharacterized protein (TIGR02271 family)
MSRTVTAFFDSREEAEAAKARLQSSNLDADRIRIVDKDSSSSSSSGASSAESRGFFGSLADMFMPDEDRYAYQEGINRGGYLLCAQVDEAEADQAIRLLDESNSVDFDQRETEWRGQGWAGWTGGTMNNQQVASGDSYGQQQAFSESGRAISEEHIPVVEEQLRVGKREVNRGGARVRSYVRETPVHEQINLREEHVDVERRPMNERIDPARAGDMLEEREISMTEMGEEAVVAKEARVVEEVVVRKTAQEHVEQIDDTVRRTEVEVERGEDRSAFGFQDRDRDGTPDAIDTDLQRSNDPAFRR